MNMRLFNALRLDIERHNTKAIPLSVRMPLNEATIARDGQTACNFVVDAIVKAHAAELALQQMRQDMLRHLKACLTDEGMPKRTVIQSDTHMARLIIEGGREKVMLVAKQQATSQTEEEA